MQIIGGAFDSVTLEVKGIELLLIFVASAGD
jgi:hypothetical protein